MTPLELQVADAWQIASLELGFRVTAPATIDLAGSSKLIVPALVHGFGRKLGTIVLVLGEPSERLASAVPEQYYYSLVAPHYNNYQRDLIIETLNDWGYFGTADARPSWYTGAAHV